VSQSAVAKYMRRHPRPPSQTWRTFLTNHAGQIMAADLFVVPTVTFRLLFVLVILVHDRHASFMSPSPTIRLPAGSHNTFGMPSLKTRRPATWCMIATVRSLTSRPPLPA
jgi:hypothetical protein